LEEPKGERRGRLALVAACLLAFGPDATWGAAAPRPVASGATVIHSSDRLAQAAASLLG